ncbi:DNA primase [Desulforamulus ruminis]|uniref:DNA primase n=1 Tax=Desulforamulus ruminis TaxID=1564 RepID=UPI0023539F08|nr:DNA primase [Desulforamulus ruminis]
MSSLISEDIIEDIKQKSDIVEVISQYLSSERRGKNFVARCPFHQEKTPSFNINPEKQIFHCFGCGVGGNVFKFIMMVEGLSFPEAVRFLGAKAGVMIPEERSPRDLARQNKKNRALEIYGLVRDVFRFWLSKEVGLRAVQYLEKRNLSQEVRETFQLGYSLPGWDHLVRFLNSKDISSEELAKLGLIQAKETGRYFDRFRDRIMFPIWDPQGRVVGFGGRTLGDDTPKYLNSPEGEYFNKGQLLYGLHIARRGIREQGFAVLMEGYLDVVSTYQHGVTNAVASLGTAFTREQGKLLMNYTHQAVVAYDADEAGIKAAIRASEILQELGCQVRIASIPEYKDPDEFIQRHGLAGWSKIIDAALPLVHFKLTQAVKKVGLKNSTAKRSILQEVLPNLAAVASPLELEEAVRYTATVLQLNWETVLAEIKAYKANNRKKYQNRHNTAENSHNIASNSHHRMQQTPQDARTAAEAGLLRLALEDKTWLDRMVAELGKDFFQNPVYQEIFNRILNQNLGQDLLNRMDQLEESQQRVLSKLLVQEIPRDDLVQIFSDFVLTIKKSSQKARLEDLLVQLATAERLGDTEKVLFLRRQVNLTIMKSEGPERGVAT